MATAKKVPVNAVQGNGDILYLNLHVKDARTRDVLVDGKKYSFVSINKLPFGKQKPIFSLQARIAGVDGDAPEEMVQVADELFTTILGEEAYAALENVLSMADLMELFQVLMSGEIPSEDEVEDEDEDEVTTEKK